MSSASSSSRAASVVLATALCACSPRAEPRPPTERLSPDAQIAVEPDAATDHELEDQLERLSHGSTAAARWLVEHAGRARPRLIASLDHPPDDDGYADLAALEVLAQIGNADDVAIIAARMREGAPRRTLQLIAYALSVHPAPAAAQALTTAVGSVDAEVAEAAVMYLGLRADDLGRMRLEEALEDERPRVRMFAVQALMRLGYESSKAPLEAALRVETDNSIKTWLRKALNGEKPPEPEPGDPMDVVVDEP